MGSTMIPLVFLLYSVFLLQFLQRVQTEGNLKLFEEMQHGKDWNNHLRSSGMKMHDHSSSSSNIEPELNVFFHYNDLKVGNKMSIYFPTKDPSTSPHLLSRQESDSIPFSSSRIPYILELFSFSEGSKQAKAMADTLYHCEFPPLKGESKFCATSLEFMLDSLHEIFGLSSKFRVLTTSYLSESISLLQNYRVSEPLMQISAPKIIACHTLPYPYAVFYCHGQVSDNKLYKVSLEGDDGGRVEATAMCHMDTSQWDPNHNAFRVLKSVPGASPVCHFFPSDNLVWVPIS
ncbi:hypothetical protein C2S52_018146 [Perilla frutescens var. hirtella]|nr:hypothetical protein C2S52_018146 [Perilla frutescens var. hirtella]KAH6811881.1 hypothetical protein C2S51_025643 [Perilla frutescens var. frutescens]